MQHIFYKLVDKNLQTHGGYQWTLGKRHRATGQRRQGLCSGEYLHVYKSKEQAALMAPAHGIGHYSILLEVRGHEHIKDGTKVGLRQCTVLRVVDQVLITKSQRIAIAILCAARVYQDPFWLMWAKDWLNSNNRGSQQAHVTADTAFIAVNATHATTRAAAYAAYAAASAASTASTAAAVTYVAHAANAARINITKICRLVLSTPEEDWFKLLEEEE